MSILLIVGFFLIVGFNQADAGNLTLAEVQEESQHLSKVKKKLKDKKAKLVIDAQKRKITALAVSMARPKTCRDLAKIDPYAVTGIYRVYPSQSKSSKGKRMYCEIDKRGQLIREVPVDSKEKFQARIRNNFKFISISDSSAANNPYRICEARGMVPTGCVRYGDRNRSSAKRLTNARKMYLSTYGFGFSSCSKREKFPEKLTVRMNPVVAKNDRLHKILCESRYFGQALKVTNFYHSKRKPMDFKARKFRQKCFQTRAKRGGKDDDELKYYTALKCR